MILEDKWTDLEHIMFKAVRAKLRVIGLIAMKGSRIVLPQKMQKPALVLAHYDTKVGYAPRSDYERSVVA